MTIQNGMNHIYSLMGITVRKSQEAWVKACEILHHRGGMVRTDAIVCKIQIFVTPRWRKLSLITSSVKGTTVTMMIVKN